MSYAVFRFTSDYGLRHVQFCGMRTDVDDDTELCVWREYQDIVSHARLEHNKMVLDRVTALFKPQGFRKFNVPNTDYKLDLYEGVHYRSVALSELDTMIDTVVSMEDEGNQARLAHDLMVWHNSLLQDDDFAYVADRHPWARNTVGINMDAFSPFQKLRGREQKDSAHTCNIPHLIKAVPLLEIYLTNRAETIDPMHVVWKGDQIIVPDLKFLIHQENKLPECV